MHPDNSEFLEIIRNKKIKILPQDYSRMELFLENEFEQAREQMLHYDSLLSSNCKMPQDESKLLVEIIAGYDINLTKKRNTPFVEVIQNVAGMPMVVKESLADPNSTTGTDQIDSMSTCLRNTEDEKVDKISRKSTKLSKLVLSTPVPIERTDEGAYEWSRFFPLTFDSTCVEKERSITVNLYRTKTKKNK